MIQSLSIIIHSSAVVHAILARQFQKEGGPGYYYFLNFFLLLVLWSMTRESSSWIQWHFAGVCAEMADESSSWPTADQGWIICDGLEILCPGRWLNVQHLFIGDFYSSSSLSRHRREWRATVTSSCARLLVLCPAFYFFGCGPGRRRSIVSAQSRRWGSKYILFHYYY